MLKNVIFIVSITLFFIFSGTKVLASSADTKAIIIFDKTSYLADEKVELTINLSNFSDLYKVTLEINVPSDVLQVIKSKNSYFYDESANQIFSSNDCNGALNIYNESEAFLNYIVVKYKYIQDGYKDEELLFSNRLVTISFIAKVNIDNIFEYFCPSDVYEEKHNMYLVLEDTSRNKIPYTPKFCEKVRYEWTKEYSYNVGSPIDNSSQLIDDIVLLNRDKSDLYLGLDFSQVNVNEIGRKGIILIIKDYQTKDITYDIKYIDIIDTVSPIISGPKILTIDDDKISDAVFDQYIVITDNYCKRNELTIIYTYYDSDNNVINDSDIKIYLTVHPVAYLRVEVSDSSNNAAIPFTLEIRIIDKTPPTVLVLDDITLVNDEVENFVFEDHLSILDNYDPSPMLILTFFDITGLNIDDYQAYLKMGKAVIITYFGQDESFNQTNLYQTIISVSDTIKPTIEADAEIIINDTSINSFDPYSQVTYYDNFEITTQPVLTYYASDQTTLINNLLLFKEYLSQGSSGYIKYQITDNMGSISDPVIQKVIPLDVTCPIIKVVNVAPNAMYSQIEKIEYVITDNFGGAVDVAVSLNGNPYEGLSIRKNGQYQLIIVATDEAGNENQLVLDFEIFNKKLFNGEGPVIEFINEHYEIIIGSCVLVIIITYLVVYLIRKKKNSKR